MSPSTTQVDPGAVVKLSSTAKKLHTTRIPVIKRSEDLMTLLDSELERNSGISDVEDIFRSKRALDSVAKPTEPLSAHITSHSTAAVDRVIDKRQRYDRPSDYITQKSLTAASVAERKLDLTDDDVAFLISYNQILRKGAENDSSVLFTDEDFIKSFYKWDVESIKSSIARGVAKMQRIDSASAFSFLKSAGVKKDIPEDLFSPLYDYYCRRWDGHQNLPVCRCSWVIIQQLNEYKNLVSSAKLA